MAGEFRVIADAVVAGRRIDAWLAAVAGVSRRRARELLESGEVELNSALAKPSRHVREGDVLAGRASEAEPWALAAEEGTVPILYQDRHMLVLDKPAGLTVHPGAGRRSGTLVNILLGMGIKLAPAGGKLRPGIVHRLDRETSGLMLAAKTDQAYWALIPQVAGRKIRREYTALVAGKPSPRKGTINAALARSSRHHDRFTVVSSGGRNAVTHYEVAECFQGASLVKVRLETGRTHQIRVHFAACGWPLLGDKAYARPRAGLPQIGRHALHAARIALAHPVSGKPLSFTSPLPLDMRLTLAQLRAL